MAVSRRVKSALLWGAVGYMSFMVLLQAVAVLAEPLLSLAQGAAVAVLVGAVTAGSAYVLEHRVAAWAAARQAAHQRSGSDESKS